MRSEMLRNSIPASMTTFVMLVLSAACLYWAKPVLVPAALAILLSILLTPVVIWLQRHGLNRGFAVGMAVGMAGLFIVVVGWVIAAQLVGLAEQLPTYQSNISSKIAAVRASSKNSLITRWDAFVREISAEATKPPEPDPSSGATPAVEVPPIPVRIMDDGWHWDNLPNASSIAGLIEPIAVGGLVLVLVIYLLFNREDVRNRLLCLLGDGQMTRTTRAIDDAGRRISRFLLMQFVLNASFGVFIGSCLSLLGLPYALFWGIWAAFMRYIPLIGPWILAAFPIALSLLTADGWQQPLMVMTLFVVAEVLVNLVIEPWLYGQSIGVSQGALLFAIAFWTWLWGMPGLMLAAPLTVCLAVLGRHVPALKIFDIVLGDEPTLTTEMQFYQRLLARDQDEASELLQKQMKMNSLVNIYDEICVPALVAANRDEVNGLISDTEQQRIAEMIRDLVEENAIPVEQDAVSDAPDESVAAADEASRLVVLCHPARNHSDEIALELFQKLIDPRVYECEVLTRSHLVTQIIEQIEITQASVFCITALPPGGLAHTRLLSKRLRQRFPSLKILVARWGILADEREQNAEQVHSSGADYLSGTMEETCAQLLNVARLDRHPAPGAAIEAANRLETVVG
jgi:predicted PurR-regulated permease PerM